MGSLVWEDATFSQQHSENFRRRCVSSSFFWLTLNVVPALWLSAFVDPFTVFFNIANLGTQIVVVQLLLIMTLCFFIVSSARHTYLLLNALDVQKIFLSKVESTSNGNCQVGPSVFPESPARSSMHSFRLSSPNVSYYGVPMGNGSTRSSWCPPATQSYSPGEQPSLNVSIPNPQASLLSASRQPPPKPSPSPHSLDRSSIWHSPSFSDRSNLAPRWPTATTPHSSPSLTPPRQSIASVVPTTATTGSLQYQLSPSRAVGCADVTNIFRAGRLSGGRSPEEKSVPRTTSDSNVSERDAMEYWSANNVTPSDLDRWAVNMRRWLHGTILRRVVEEISSANAKMSKTSEDAVLIGSTTLNTLELLSRGKYQHILSLPTLLRFLDCTKEQGYLVFRLRELARGSCLGEFRWDGGSRSTVSPWKDYLPTDTMILLHIFSVYMDARLPAHPKCIFGRSFSQLHLVRSPDKPDLKAKYMAQLYVTNAQPPSIKVVSDGISYSFPSDRNNLYHALLMFLHIYLSLDGTLRCVSLGQSGLNVAWIFQRE